MPSWEPKKLSLSPSRAWARGDGTPRVGAEQPGDLGRPHTSPPKGQELLWQHPQADLLLPHTAPCSWPRLALHPPRRAAAPPALAVPFLPTLPAALAPLGAGDGTGPPGRCSPWGGPQENPTDANRGWSPLPGGGQQLGASRRYRGSSPPRQPQARELGYGGGQIKHLSSRKEGNKAEEGQSRVQRVPCAEPGPSRPPPGGGQPRSSGTPPSGALGVPHPLPLPQRRPSPGSPRTSPRRARG